MINQALPCRKCSSTNLVKNGYNSIGNPKSKCKDCGFGGVIVSKRASEATKEKAAKAYQEKSSLRGVGRIFGVSYQTILNWVKKKAMNSPKISETLSEPVENEILELDELWSFVYEKVNKQWLWIALCRRTKEVVAFFLGDRSEKSCQQLWDLVPQNYKHSITYSDFWSAYEKVIQTGKHSSVGKETGQTAHVERWNNTLRQRIGRYVRKTLSFSKSQENHFLFTHSFICNYNLSLNN